MGSDGQDQLDDSLQDSGNIAAPQENTHGKNKKRDGSQLRQYQARRTATRGAKTARTETDTVAAGTPETGPAETVTAAPGARETDTAETGPAETNTAETYRTETSSPETGMNRDVISGGEIQRLVRMRDGDKTSILDDEALLLSRRSFIPDIGLDDDLLVFGYGSLIWNPCMKVKDSFSAHLFGFHRRFCLSSTIGRGSPDAPGLVLGLDFGGSVSGVCFQIDKHDCVREADLLWRREMLNGSYLPKWVNVKTDNGIKRALTFIINRAKPAYTPRMTAETTAEIISKASGFVGSNVDYLISTESALRDAGIYDPLMARLVELVLQRQKQ